MANKNFYSYCLKQKVITSDSNYNLSVTCWVDGKLICGTIMKSTDSSEKIMKVADDMVEKYYNPTDSDKELINNLDLIINKLCLTNPKI